MSRRRTVVATALVCGAWFGACDAQSPLDPAAPISLALSPNPVVLRRAETRALSVAGRTRSGRALSVEDVSFSSSNDEIVTVNSNGVVSGVNAGVAVIVARVGSVEATVGVRVEPLYPVSEVSAECAAPGTIHAGDITYSQTWSASDSPHHVIEPIEVSFQRDHGSTIGAVLTIEPGSVICFGPQDGISAAPNGILDAIATGDAPILFTAALQGDPWAGVGSSSAGGYARFSNVLVEHAVEGIVGRSGVEVRSSTIRDIQGVGLVVTHPTLVSDVVVERAGLDGSSPAAYLNAGTLRRISIRDSGGPGVQINGRRTSISIEGCAITGNAGDGVQVLWNTLWRATVRDCNIEENAGNGVTNLSQVTVDARSNWWGDAAGPNGPDGDGVSNGVDFREYSTSRIVHGGS